MLKQIYRSLVPAAIRRRVDYWRVPAATRRKIDRLLDVGELHKEAQRDLFRNIGFFAKVNRPISGAYLEFGCFGAHTMRFAWNAFGHFGWDFYAFDSFEGLPEITAIDKQEIWQKGKLAMGEREFRKLVTSAGMPNDRLRTIKGFYSDSLTPRLEASILPRKAAVIYIDCDLYESAVNVLKWIRPFLQQGTILAFDDWDAFLADPDKGERRAWREFLEANPTLRFEEFYYRAMVKALVFQGAHPQ